MNNSIALFYLQMPSSASVCILQLNKGNFWYPFCRNWATIHLYVSFHDSQSKLTLLQLLGKKSRLKSDRLEIMAGIFQIYPWIYQLQQGHSWKVLWLALRDILSCLTQSILFIDSLLSACFEVNSFIHLIKLSLHLFWMFKMLQVSMYFL